MPASVIADNLLSFSYGFRREAAVGIPSQQKNE